MASCSALWERELSHKQAQMAMEQPIGAEKLQCRWCGRARVRKFVKFAANKKRTQRTHQIKIDPTKVWRKWNERNAHSFYGTHDRAHTHTHVLAMQSLSTIFFYFSFLFLFHLIWFDSVGENWIFVANVRHGMTYSNLGYAERTLCILIAILMALHLLAADWPKRLLREMTSAAFIGK